MRYPVDNWGSEWNINAGYGFGAKTSYGYHEGTDLNDNGGGNSDLGKSLFAIADGVITSVHIHTTKPTFGKHIHLKIDGAWGTRWVHYAHCQDIFVTEGQLVKEGQRIATVGNSGTDWAHCHFAVKKEPTGIDGIAISLDLLKKWEDPIKFIETWFSAVIPQENVYTDQTKIPLGQYGELEIQQIKGKLGDLDRVQKQLEDAITTNNQQVILIEDLRKQLANIPTSPNFPSNSLEGASLADLLKQLLKRLSGT